MSEKTGQDEVTFFKNCCPKCGSENISLITTEDEESKMRCTECELIFEIKDAKKKQVGESKDI